jgi:hypothetical protein
VQGDEKGVYIIFSETTEELKQSAEPQGWTLRAIVALLPAESRHSQKIPSEIGVKLALDRSASFANRSADPLINAYRKGWS